MISTVRGRTRLRGMRKTAWPYERLIVHTISTAENTSSDHHRPSAVDCRMKASGRSQSSAVAVRIPLQLGPDVPPLYWPKKENNNNRDSCTCAQRCDRTRIALWVWNAKCIVGASFKTRRLARREYGKPEARKRKRQQRHTRW